MQQVNDDLELQTTGWSTLFVGELGSHNGFGVAGPLDPFLHGRILTQAFVGRIHFSIFGRFYPLDIKVTGVGMRVDCIDLGLVLRQLDYRRVRTRQILGAKCARPEQKRPRHTLHRL